MGMTYKYKESVKGYQHSKISDQIDKFPNSVRFCRGRHCLSVNPIFVGNRAQIDRSSFSNPVQ